MIDIGSFVSDFVNGLLKMVLDFVIYIVNLILLPFDLLISTFFPNFNDLIVNINNAFSVALTYIGWVIDSVGIDNITLIFLVDYLIFKLTIPLQVYVIKLAIKWYNYIKT